MFILLIFLAELSAAILAFIFRENVSILWWAKYEPQWDCTQLERGVQMVADSDCLFQMPTNLLHYYLQAAELPASQRMLTSLACARWMVYVQKIYMLGDHLSPGVFSLLGSFTAKPSACSIREKLYNKVTLRLKALFFFFNIAYV